MEKQKIIIDTDPGIDDAMAILFALGSAEVEVLGLTITHGNLGREEGMAQLVRNARRVLRVAGRADIPVYAGARKPLVHEEHDGAAFVHGKDGMGDVAEEGEEEAVDDDSLWGSESAAQYLVRTINAQEGEVAVVALGPLTNLGIALALDPSIARKVQYVAIMGGAFAYPGNITPLAEANIYNDPVAANLVFSAPWSIRLAPLNVTQKLLLNGAFLDRIVAANARVGSWIASIVAFYLQFHADGGLDHAYVHDSSAIMAIVAPDVYTKHTQNWVRVEPHSLLLRGVTVCDLRRLGGNQEVGHERNVTIYLDVDTEKYYTTYCAAIAALPK